MDNQNQNSGSSLVAGLFWGGIIGLAIGILYAPQSGRETREMLMKTAGEAKDSALEMVGNAQDKADDIVRKARETKDKLVNAATAATDRAAKIIEDAEKKADEIVRQARETANEIMGDGEQKLRGAK